MLGKFWFEIQMIWSQNVRNLREKLTYIDLKKNSFNESLMIF